MSFAGYEFARQSFESVRDFLARFDKTLEPLFFTLPVDQLFESDVERVAHHLPSL